MKKTYRTVQETGRYALLALVMAGLIWLPACGGSSGMSSGGNSGTGVTPVNNTESLQVNLGPANNDANVPLVSVTVCVPGSTTQCQTVPDVEVDTGSEGLRILSSALTISLPAVTDSSNNPLANCLSFADNSYVWGPVVGADVDMAGETASGVPIQIIGDPSFTTVPTACNIGGPANNTTAVLGANGILGVGVFRQDCGQACAGTAGTVPAVYFSCPNSLCTSASKPVSVPVQNQLQNPVWVFAQDNNGLVLTFPSVPASGSPTVTGSITFGIATQTDNTLGTTAQVYDVDGFGNFITTYNGQQYTSSYIDSGSNGLYFLDTAATGLPDCSKTGTAPGFYCPTTTTSFTATNSGATNGVSGPVTFSVANAETLFQSSDAAFVNLAGPSPNTFDWGLPFFYGRTVYIGIEGQTSPAGTGPYWAY